MEKVQQQHWWKLRWSYRNATILVSLFNLIAALFLLQSFFFSTSPTTKSNSVERYIRESEEIRRAMMPVNLIKRVKEIENEAYIEVEPLEHKDVKQGAAVDLITRMNNIRSYSEASGMKALEEWRKRKMERARKRELGKDGTTI
nr:Translation initiation factor IF-2 like [Ipomoea batatas]